MLKPPASPTYLCDVVVFHKTRLSEKDLILDMVADSGEIIRAVAKSARKPGNTFSNRLDLFNVAHICVAKTKSIDIIREAVLIEHFDVLRQDIQLLAAASTISEILWRLTFDGEANPVMFDFMRKTFKSISDFPQLSKTLTIAGSFKLLSLEGFRPALKFCADCGNKIKFDSDYLTFSPSCGGVLCHNCKPSEFDFSVSSKTVQLIDWLITSTYDDILNQGDRIGKRAYEMGKILKKWTQYHVNCPLKSLNLALH